MCCQAGVVTSFALPLNMWIVSCELLLAGKSQAGVGVANDLYTGPIYAGKVYTNHSLPGHFQWRWRLTQGTDGRPAETPEASRNTRSTAETDRKQQKNAT